MALRLTPSTTGGFAVVGRTAEHDYEPQEHAVARDIRAEAEKEARKIETVGFVITAVLAFPATLALLYSYRFLAENGHGLNWLLLPVTGIALILGLLWSIVNGMADGRRDDAEFMADLYEQIGRGEITEHQAMVLIQQRRQIQLAEAQLAAAQWTVIRSEMHHYQQMAALNRISRKL